MCSECTGSRQRGSEEVSMKYLRLTKASCSSSTTVTVKWLEFNMATLLMTTTCVLSSVGAESQAKQIITQGQGPEPPMAPGGGGGDDLQVRPCGHTDVRIWLLPRSCCLPTLSNPISSDCQQAEDLSYLDLFGTWVTHLRYLHVLTSMKKKNCKHPFPSF